MQKTPIEHFMQSVAELVETCTGLPVDRNALPEGQSREKAQSITLHKDTVSLHDTAIAGRPLDLTFKVRLVGKDREQIAENVMEPLAFAVIDAMEPDNLNYACSSVLLEKMVYVQDGDGDDMAVVPIELTFIATLPDSIGAAS